MSRELRLGYANGGVKWIAWVYGENSVDTGDEAVKTAVMPMALDIAGKAL